MASSQVHLVDLSVTHKAQFLDNFVETVVEAGKAEGQPEGADDLWNDWVLQNQNDSDGVEPHIQ